MKLCRDAECAERNPHKHFETDPLCILYGFNITADPNRILSKLSSQEQEVKSEFDAREDVLDADDEVNGFSFEDTPEFWKQLGKRIVRNVRLNRNRPRWVGVADVTGHGSTYSKDLCRYFGLDPNEMVGRRK